MVVPKEENVTKLKGCFQGREQIYTEQLENIKEKPIYNRIKRIFDFTMALLVLIVLFVPMCILAVAIRIDSSGSPIFRQIRLGKMGRPFVLYKFRSMREDAEKDGAQWAVKDDPRVTRLGKILRRTRIDELPQLFNILIGDMSFVGPRPERPEFYDIFETYIHGFRQRMLMLPGLTGYAQVNGGYNLLPEEKITYDLAYIKNRSVWLDLKCILKTVRIIFVHEGAR